MPYKFVADSFHIGDFAPTVPVDRKFHVEKGRPHQPFFFSEN